MLTLDTILEEREFDPPHYCAISNRLVFPDTETLKYLEALFEVPGQVILWREKDLTREENRPFVRTGSELASGSGKLFLVSSDVELALQEGADGAHLTSKQDLEAACRMRKEAGKERFLLGKSVHSVSEVIFAERQGGDYVLLAPIFDPISKVSYSQALGIEVLKEAADSVSIPVFALGGIREERVRAVIEVGAFGVAGISWVYPYVERELSGSGDAG